MSESKGQRRIAEARRQATRHYCTDKLALHPSSHMNAYSRPQLLQTPPSNPHLVLRPPPNQAEAGPWLQALHFSFGSGIFLGPMLISLEFAGAGNDNYHHHHHDSDYYYYGWFLSLSSSPPPLPPLPPPS